MSDTHRKARATAAPSDPRETRWEGHKSQSPKAGSLLLSTTVPSSENPQCGLRSNVSNFLSGKSKKINWELFGENFLRSQSRV